MQITWYTKETAEHRPVLTGKPRRYEQFNLENWHKVHAALLADPEAQAKRREYSTTLHYPPCGACDWDAVQKDSEAARARRDIKRNLAIFERTGKFPAGHVAIPKPLKFGGAVMSDKEAARVVLPRIPLSPRPGSDGFLLPEDLIIEDQIPRYLNLINRKGPKHYIREEECKVWGNRGRKTLIRLSRWRCGCSREERRDGNRDEWGTPTTTPCAKHKGAINGRDEITGEIIG